MYTLAPPGVSRVYVVFPHGDLHQELLKSPFLKVITGEW